MDYDYSDDEITDYTYQDQESLNFKMLWFGVFFTEQQNYEIRHFDSKTRVLGLT